jgi:hypothetical protein
MIPVTKSLPVQLPDAVSGIDNLDARFGRRLRRLSGLGWFLLGMCAGALVMTGAFLFIRE